MTAPVLERLLSASPGSGDWRHEALCAQADPDAFFPGTGVPTKPAKRVCLGCPVRAECLQYALATDERFGIWGGLSAQERRALKARNNAITGKEA